MKLKIIQELHMDLIAKSIFSIFASRVGTERNLFIDILLKVLHR